MLKKKSSTSRRSRRQNLAQGGASAASGTLGHEAINSSGVLFSATPRATLRFTSFRFACPGLNSAAGYAGSLSLILLLLSIGCSRKETQTREAASATQSPAGPVASASPASTVESYPTLVAQAQEVNDAFRRRDFARMVDLTYPKVIESAGGRDQMIAALAKGMKEMEADDVAVLSSTAGTPKQIIHVSEWIYAVVPTTLTVKAKDGTFQTESSMIGVSADKGANWRFIDAGGKDHTQLMGYLPAPSDKLNLPAEKEPVKLSGN